MQPAGSFAPAVTAPLVARGPGGVEALPLPPLLPPQPAASAPSAAQTRSVESDRDTRARIMPLLPVPVASALSRYDHVLLDLDGCVWVGDEPTPGAQ